MKKSLSFMLALIMVLCMIPGMALAAGDTWDGTADASWYNNTDTEFVLTTAEQLAGLAELVDGGNNFAGKAVKLGADLDLAGSPFNPIGHSANGKSFNGTFDGQGHTISNMYEQSDLSAWQYEGEYYGLFAYTNGATIMNLTVADAYISSGRNEAAGVVGNAVDTTFSDITISNTTLIGYNNSVGGVAAECYGNCSFTNITVDEDNVFGPLWGTYDVRLGGVVGLVHAGNNVTFKDVTVACKLDAINDVAANYQYWLYRYCGMLIGHVDGVSGVADPTGYVTCENVKVIYGDWVNYHYCEFEHLGAGSYNDPGDYKYARVEAGTGTGGIDLSTCNHTENESHNVLIVFDQLFGGGQGISGLKTYSGVTVQYALIHSTNAEDNFMNGDIYMSDDDIFTAVLTADEMAKSKPADVWLEVKALDETNVDSDEKAAIDAVAAEDEIPIYMEINLYKIIGPYDAATKQESTKTQITNLNKPITISLEIPEGELMEGYTYYVIRVHEGKAERIECKLEGNKLTFASDKFSTYAVAYEETPAPAPAPKPASSGSGISITYNGGNSFSTSKSAVPTSVEIDGVEVPFSGNGSSFTVGCIDPNAEWVTVRWNSTSVTVNFKPDVNVVCTEVMIPKTGDMPLWAAVAQFFGF